MQAQFALWRLTELSGCWTNWKVEQVSELESGLPWSSSGGRLGFEGSKALKKDPLLTCKSRIPTKPTCRQCKHGQILLHTLSHPLARLSPLGCLTCRSPETCNFCLQQRFHPQQIICICADICTFPDLQCFRKWNLVLRTWGQKLFNGEKKDFWVKKGPKKDPL